jgi:hypothetical protein
VTGLIVGIEPADEVVLTDRPVHPYLVLGHVGAKRAVGLVQVGEGTVVDGGTSPNQSLDHRVRRLR